MSEYFFVLPLQKLNIDIMEQKLYPLKFMPLFKNKIWGGNKIRDIMHIDYSPLPNCGELWVLSAVEDNETIIENGYLQECTLKEAIGLYFDDIVGEKCFDKFQDNFPLLFKIIDANDALSIQVHPDDKMARKMGEENGKNEMWYIIDAEKDSQIIDGFNKDLTKTEFINSLNNKNLTSILNIEKPNKGDFFFIPSGRIHAIGKGVLLAEIQQSSDTTFRVYDWDRKDEKGKGRKLHIEEALEALDFRKAPFDAKGNYDYKLNNTSKLLDTPYFTTNVLHLSQALKKDFSLLDSFIVYLCIEGSGFIHSLNTKVEIKMGEAILVPALCNDVIIEPKGYISLIETYM
ncbi:MAG: class I mannose-6-phosphate isomerase [Bacteroidales bacterium]|jgi:mannose-6-phosphate isomerase|nr:class I mannose-6-phosphate isomerase [Bacteroidales bacterium]